MRQIIREAYAKINLGLDVVGRREDGYHLVRMIMQEIGVHDTLTVTAAGVPEGAPLIRLKTDSTEIPIGPDNLICHAAYIMCEEFDIRDEITIDLRKRIPVAAGLAGGSTDAAAVFMALRDLYAPSVTDQQLQELALPLGADIPYCIAGGTRLSEGIGEKLVRLPDAPQCHLVLVKPPVAVNTGMVYRTLDSLAEYPHPDIDGMIDRIWSELGEEAVVIATGGLSGSITPLCRHNIILDDDLLLRGLNYIYRKNTENAASPG